MHSFRTKIALCLFVGMAAWGLSSCGGGVECGNGTKAKDGKCVSTSNLECADGTTQKDGQCLLGSSGCDKGTQFSEEAGKCVVTPETCGEDTTLDSDSQNCVAAIECGENTVEEDGSCKPDTDTLCDGMDGPIQYDPSSGRCKIAAAACGEGAQLDPNSGTCKKAEKYCPSGKTWDDDGGECVETETLCNDGTHFKNGVCMPDDFCEMGDIVYNGKCVSPAKKKADNADVTESETDDPTLGGQPNTLTLESSGNSSTFTGTIEKPSDQNGDGITDQDWDVYEFSANAGDWVQLSVQSIGSPQPHFIVKGPNGWTRSAGSGLSKIAARQLALPASGDYEVWVAPASVALNDAGPIGSQDWDYVGTLTNLGAPSPSTLDMTMNDATGNFMKLTDNIFEVQGFSKGDLLKVTAKDVGEDIDGVLSIWKNPATHHTSLDIESGDSVVLRAPDTSSGNFLMHLDWKSANGPNDVFTVGAEKITDSKDLGQISKDGSKKGAKTTIGEGGSLLYEFSVKSGQIIEFSHIVSNFDDPDLALLHKGHVLTEIEAMDPRDDYSPEYGYWYSPNGGHYQLRVATHESDEKAEDLEVEVASMTPKDLGQKGQGDTITHSESNSLDEGKSRFYKVDFKSAAALNGTIEKGDSDNEATIRLYETPFESVYSQFQRSGNFTLDTVPVPKGVHLLGFSAEDDFSSYDIDLSVGTSPTVETEPNDTLGSASPADTTKKNAGDASSGDPDHWRINLMNKVGSDEVLLVDVVGADASNWSCELIDSSGATVSSYTGNNHGCLLMFGSLQKGTYFLDISNEDSDSKAYYFSLRRESGILESEPNNKASKAMALNWSKWTMGRAMYAELPTRNDTDFHKFTLPSALGSKERLLLEYENIGPEPEPHTVELQDGSNSKIGETGGLNNAIVKKGLSQGDYFLKALDGHSSGGNQYTLRAQTFTYDKSGTYTFSGTGPGKRFPDDDKGGVSTRVSGPTCSNITDVKVGVDILHKDWQDLQIELHGPNRNTVVLKEAGPDVDADDGETFTHVFPTSFDAANPLSKFNGKSASGTWGLTVSDRQPDKRSGFIRDPGNGGFVKSWTLYLDCQ